MSTNSKKQKSAGRGGKRKATISEVSESASGSAKRHRTNVPQRTSHTATLHVPTDDVNVQELHHASVVDDITNAVMSQLSDSIRTEISSHVQRLGLSSGGNPITSESTSGVVTSSTQAIASAQQIDTSRASAVPSSTTRDGVQGSLASSPAPTFSVDISHNQSNNQSFISATLPLHSTVPTKIKEKIWANEFVELSTIFDEDCKLNNKFTLDFSDTGALVTANPRKRFLTIEQWTDVFAKFASVMRLKYPDSAEPLAQYSSTVRSIARASGNWHYYDTQFRKLRQNTELPWNVIQHELYFQALNQRYNQPFRFRQNINNQSLTFKKSCNKFNRGEHCAGCAYAHICSICGGNNHAKFRCWKRNKIEHSNTRNTQHAQSDNQPSNDASNNKNTKK